MSETGCYGRFCFSDRPLLTKINCRVVCRQRNQPMNRREAIIAGAVSIAAALPAVVNAQASENPEVEPIRALLKAHDEAFTNHNLDGVMACLTEKAAIMGTGPGEIWSGPDEIKVAYEHFFQGFDQGKQKYEYQFKIAGVTSEMGWLMTSGNITGEKAGKEFTYPINLSLTVAKNAGKWLIAAMHFSTLTGASGTEGT
jgi:ketosteroid isomerase-like protein